MDFKEIIEKWDVENQDLSCFLALDALHIKCFDNCHKCQTKIKDYLLHGYKFQLTVAEHDLLNLSLAVGFKYIVRDKDTCVCLFHNKPEKEIDHWSYYDEYDFQIIDSSLFPFIKWEDKKPLPIKHILDNCEVIDK